MRLRIDIDECASNPCVNGACTDGENRWECACEPGWTGEHCDTGRLTQTLPFLLINAYTMNGHKNAVENFYLFYFRSF